MRDIEKVTVVPNVFSKAECEDLMARFDAHQSEFRQGGIYRRVDGEYRKVVDEKMRKVQEYQVPTGTEFADIRSRMGELGRKVNDEKYDFNLDGKTDRMIYTHYTDGCFFEQHKDAFSDSEFGYKKLAMTLQLSANEDFTGGRLIIDHGGGEQPVGQGSVIIFPGYLVHMVSIVNGTRKVVVNWCTSDTPFR